MKKNILLLAAIMLLCGCNANANSSTSSGPIDGSSESIVTNKGFTLKMFGGLYLNTSRTIYAELEGYEGQEILWTSSNPSVVSVSPREGLTTECDLMCKKTGTVVITAQDSKNTNNKVSKEFVIEEGEVMPSELFNQVIGGVKLTSVDQCISYDDDLNPTVDEEYIVETIYEESNPDNDLTNTSDAYQISILDKKTNKTQKIEYVKGTGGYVCKEYLDYTNNINYRKVLNEDEEGIKWDYSYYCNLWRNTELITNDCFRTFDGGKTYHYSSYYVTPIYLCASMYLLDMSPDDMYFAVNDDSELELHIDVDPYSPDADTQRTGRKIVSKISDVNTAKIEHLKPYEHLSIHDRIDEARNKMAALKNYNATVTLDFAYETDYKYDFTFTDDTIDYVVYQNDEVHLHEGSHKDGDDSYFTYQYDDTTDALTIVKKYTQSWDSVNRYPTFDFASEIFEQSANNKYVTIGTESMFIIMCAYLNSSFNLYTFENEGYLELTEDNYVKKINTTVNALGESLNVTIEYSNYNNAKCDIDFDSLDDNNLPTSFEEVEPALYSNMVDWKIEDVVPYLYSSVGYKTSVFHVKNDDRTKALYAYINTNAFENATNRDKFIEDYKQLLLDNGFVSSGTTESNTGFALYTKGEYSLGVGAKKSWSGSDTLEVQIIIVSDLLEIVA